MTIDLRRRFIIIFVAMLCAAGCHSRSASEDATAGVIVVNAPASGEVRRVLVPEGAHVAAGAAIVEIIVREEQPASSAQTQPTEDPQARAARGVTAARSEIETARAEVVRTQVEVDRLTPLVSAGQATQGELDGARAQYYQAQQRLQHAQDAAQSAQSGLIASRQQTATTAPQVIPSERIVAAVATSAGVVSVINTRAGDRVALGQPLATLRADSQ
jgi:multidrug efflux pump subunit AcrA (membrane-fusion protein)